MIVPIIAVLALFEEGAELDGLVGLVVVHGPEAESRGPKDERSAQDDEEEPAKGCFVHLTGTP
jgi:hypothetical protein